MARAIEIANSRVVHVSCVTVRASVLPVLPAAGNCIATKRNLGSKRLISERQLPSQTPELGQNIHYSIVSPARKCRTVVGGQTRECDIGDRRLSAYQGAVVSPGSIDCDVECAVAETRRHQRHAILGRSTYLGVGVVFAFIGYDVSPDGDVRVAEGRGYCRLPRYLFNRNLHSICLIPVASDVNGCGAIEQ